MKWHLYQGAYRHYPRHQDSPNSGRCLLRHQTCLIVRLTSLVVGFNKMGIRVHSQAKLTKRNIERFEKVKVKENIKTNSQNLMWNKFHKMFSDIWALLWQASIGHRLCSVLFFLFKFYFTNSQKNKENSRNYWQFVLLLYFICIYVAGSVWSGSVLIWRRWRADLRRSRHADSGQTVRHMPRPPQPGYYGHQVQ